MTGLLIEYSYATEGGTRVFALQDAEYREIDAPVESDEQTEPASD
jgi:hypothetical protein